MGQIRAFAKPPNTLYMPNKEAAAKPHVVVEVAVEVVVVPSSTTESTICIRDQSKQSNLCARFAHLPKLQMQHVSRAEQ